MLHRPENRRNPRFPCGAPAVLEGPRGPSRGLCRDISVGGFFFLGPSQPIGRSFEVKIDLPQGRIVVMAEVRYHHSYPDGSGMGLKFTRISQEDLARITAFIGAA